MTALQEMGQGLRTLARQISQIFFATIHNSFALLGLAVLFATIALAARPELRQAGETQLLGWLHNRHFGLTSAEVEPVAVERATAVHPKELSKQQAAVAYWLSKKYRVAPEPLSALVLEAYEIGRRTDIDPLLLLSVMAIESGFNPFAQSPVGAQGLMQVMTRVHSDKYEPFGGQLAAFDPVTNLRVGARVLQEYIQRDGSIEGGLRRYVGAAHLPHDGGYVAKVMAEHGRLTQVAGGQPVPTHTPQPIPVNAPAKAGGPETLVLLNS
ncbi:MAG: lytic transglycosylase domain-containing protein [Hylemonella sp.]|uniref:lytic transglycosylase domain-containing protein n=1 Tax=Hylemonella sp. TaxID=2066020 RepID=UPI0022C10807|nr:lytic transglycosylase domain-containing protein [Hylemonella sp.]MCZ8251908.1 lytic transglycosylase domain-containing protein [Hylemonella sp.]